MFEISESVQTPWVKLIRERDIYYDSKTASRHTSMINRPYRTAQSKTKVSSSLAYASLLLIFSLA